MSAPRKIWIATGKGHLGIIRQQGEMTWAEFCAQQRNVVVLPVTKAEYAQLTNDKKAALKKALGFSLAAKYRGTARKGLEIEHRDALNIDCDKLQPEVYEALIAKARELGFAFLHVGSASNEVNGKRSGRLIVPLSRPVTPKEFPAISRKIAEKLGIENVDPVSHQINQICYDPARCSDASEVFEERAGAWLDADATLAEYADWQDSKQWPRTSRELSVSSETALLGDPCEKPGLVGAWCRQYDVLRAIETFDLPYESTADEKRWTPHGASSSGGARIYGHPKDPSAASWMFNSHTHGLSPQRNVNSYDMVRMHRFGELDKDEPAGTPVSQLPSSLAMDAWIRAEHPDAVADAERVQAAAAPEFEDLDAAEGAQPSAEAPKTETPKAERRRFRPMSRSEAKNRPPIDWIVEGLLARASLFAVFGDSGVFKSFWKLNLMHHVAQGKRWRGRDVVQGKCVYICGEGAGGFSLRLQAHDKYHGAGSADAENNLSFIYNAPDLRKVADVSELIKELRALGPLSIALFDTLSSVMPGADENSSEMGVAIEHCKAIRDATGAAVGFVHHSGKDPSKGMRGWSGIRGALDTVVVIAPDGDISCATLNKQRDGEDGLRFPFERVIVPLGHDSKGRALSSCAIEQHDAVVGKRVTLPATASLEMRTIWRTLRLTKRGRLGTEELIARAVRELPRDPGANGRDRRTEKVRRALKSIITKGLAASLDDGTAVALQPECLPSPEELKALVKEQVEAEAAYRALDDAEAEAAAEAAADTDSASQVPEAPQRKPRRPRQQRKARPAAKPVVTEPAPAALPVAAPATSTASPPEWDDSPPVTTEPASVAPTPAAESPKTNGHDAGAKATRQRFVLRYPNAKASSACAAIKRLEIPIVGNTTRNDVASITVEAAMSYAELQTKVAAEITRGA
jgi:hypothetical protein